MHECLDGSERAIHACRDFVIRHRFFVKQLERNPLSIGQTFHRQCDLLTHGVGRKTLWSRFGLRFFDRRQWRVNAASGQMAARSIAGDRGQPGFQRSPRVPTIQIPRDAAERVLRCIFGVLAMPQDAEADSEDEFMVAVDENCKGPLFLSGDPSRKIATATNSTVVSRKIAPSPPGLSCML